MNPNYPCKDCANRHPGCHDHCDAYAKRKAEIAALRKVDISGRRVDWDRAAMFKKEKTKAIKARKRGAGYSGMGAKGGKQ